MATYNCADTLPEALQSIVQQTCSDWELIICDDGSTDLTYQMLSQFADHHGDQVTLLKNPTNRRLAYSLNRCLEHARGVYIARMDADDICSPDRLGRQVAYLDDHPAIDVVGTYMRRFDSGGLKDVVGLEERPGPASTRRGVPFAHATIMMRRTAYDALGGYTVCKRTDRGQDYDLWFRFFAQGRSGHNIPEPLYMVREDDDAIRRRTIASRWQSYRTTLIGFRMLGFPVRWYVRPTVGLLKALVPVRFVATYRALQSSSYHKQGRATGGRPGLTNSRRARRHGT